MPVEKRRLTAHPKLVLDVIKRQAGTLEKAVLEGAMNAIEAKAGVFNIYFDAKDAAPDKPGAQLRLSDDGRGIGSRQEVEEFFEEFGHPHDESEGKIWAQFRMGRGQIFAFGKNRWRTSEFNLIVDVEQWGLDYELHSGLDKAGGCDIIVDLYKNPVGTYAYRTIEVLKERIARLVQFMPIPIKFNGEQINTPAANCEWDMEDENAFYSFGAGIDLKVYNLGAYVMAMDARTAGTMGVIVSKKQLKVNFARNDVQHDCAVFHPHIDKVIKENRIKKTRQRRRDLDDHERIATLMDIRDGDQDFRDVKVLGLIPTSSGRHMSLEACRKMRMPWTFAPRGDRRADKLMQQHDAVCFDESILEELGYTGDDNAFFTWFMHRADPDMNERLFAKNWIPLENLYDTFENLREGTNDTYKILPDTELNVVEKRVRKVLEGFNCWDDRTICIGISDSADAWTDGQSYIVVGRAFIKRLSLSYAGCAAALLTTMCHELAHDIDTAGTHVHGESFYRRYHDITANDDSPLRFVALMYTKLNDAKLQERASAELKRQTKADERQREKIGIAAKSR